MSKDIFNAIDITVKHANTSSTRSFKDILPKNVSLLTTHLLNAVIFLLWTYMPVERIRQTTYNKRICYCQKLDVSCITRLVRTSSDLRSQQMHLLQGVFGLRRLQCSPQKERDCMTCVSDSPFCG